MGFGFSGLGAGLPVVATTGIAGFALQNATPTILTWTAPNDGQLHRVQFMGMQHVSVAETGGGVQANFTWPSGNPASYALNNANHGTGDFDWGANYTLVAPGTTVSVVQTSAQTAGAAVVYGVIMAA